MAAFSEVEDFIVESINWKVDEPAEEKAVAFSVSANCKVGVELDFTVETADDLVVLISFSAEEGRRVVTKCDVVFSPSGNNEEGISVCPEDLALYQDVVEKVFSSCEVRKLILDATVDFSVVEAASVENGTIALAGTVVGSIVWERRIESSVVVVVKSPAVHLIVV